MFTECTGREGREGGGGGGWKGERCVSFTSGSTPGGSTLPRLPVRFNSLPM